MLSRGSYRAALAIVLGGPKAQAPVRRLSWWFGEMMRA